MLVRKQRTQKIVQSKEKSWKRWRSERHNVFIERVNKIALRKDNCKRIQVSDGVTTHQKLLWNTQRI